MSEQKLFDAFESMKPTEESRQRMLQNILASQRAQGEASAAKTGEAVRGDNDADHLEAAQAVNNAEAVQNTDNAEAVQNTRERDLQGAAQSKPRPKKFSLYRYVLPIAACLILAVAMPAGLPQLTEMLDQAAFQDKVSNYGPLPAPPDETPAADPSADGQTETPATPETPNASGNDAPSAAEEVPESEQPDADAQTPSETEVIIEVPATIEAPAAVAEAEVPTPIQEAPAAAYPANEGLFGLSPVQTIAIALATLFALVALYIALKGVLAWQRVKKQLGQRD